MAADVISLFFNVHATREDKSDDSKDSVCEELQKVPCHF
jgi:hypothetical protein